jgi:hypothetical protein
MRPPGFAWCGLLLAVLAAQGTMVFARHHREVPGFVAVLAAVVLFPWVIGPVVIRLAQWESTRIWLVPVDPLGANTPAAIGRAGPELKRLGFARVRTFQMVDAVPNASAYVSVYFNDKSLDVAKVNVAVAPSREVSYLVFGSELADGSEVYTSNLAVPIVTPPLGWPVRNLAFPGVDDPARLYAIHRARVKNEPRRRPPVDDPHAYLLRTETRALDHHVERGYFYRPAEGRRQFPTWKGAVLMTWKSVWPVPAVRRALKRLRAWLALRRLAIDEQGDLRDDELDR